MPADQPSDQQPAEQPTVSGPSRTRTVAARSSAPAAATAPVTAAAKKAPAKKTTHKPTIAPSSGGGEGTVLTAVAGDGSTTRAANAEQALATSRNTQQ